MTHESALRISAAMVSAARPCVSVARWYGNGSFFAAGNGMKKHTTAPPRRVVNLA